MLLDLEDERLKARISRVSGDRVRLVLDYPAEPRYRQAVLRALSDLLRSGAAGTAPGGSETAAREER
jgi:hypothetical protein